MDHPEIKNFSEKKAMTEHGVDQDANLDADSRPYTFDAKTLDTLGGEWLLLSTPFQNTFGCG